MNFEIEAFLPSQQEVMQKMGLDKDGHIQKIIDNSFIHYMRLKMPEDSGMMITNTKNPEGGLITVETPYAHYMNEGILYVDPITGKGAFHDPRSGMFWSRANTKKVPSNTPLNYHGGPDRGAHFVERTASENFDDIIQEAQKELDKI